MKKLYVFTVHKAASTGLQKFLARVAEDAGIEHHYASSETTPLPDSRVNNDPKVVEAVIGKSGIIGPMRRPIILPQDERDGAGIVLHLRDPRDALVSMFFSWVYNHVGIPDILRDKWQDQGIDRFVVENTPDFKARYDIYMENYLNHDDCCLLAYEDFVLDRAKWARKFCDFTGFDFDTTAIRQWIRNQPDISLIASTETPTRHVRKALPGDHKEKLKPETVEALNAEWAPVLEALGYAF